MKRILIVGNWKMNLNTKEALVLVKRLDQHITLHRDIEVVLAPSLLSVYAVSKEIDQRKFRLAAQNAYYEDEGAYTGEVSFTMLRGVVSYAIIGHSERRIYFEESLETVRDKVTAAVRNGIDPILCVGENKQERLDGETKRVIHDQVTTALSNLTAEDMEHVVIAYEPVWAISTFGGGQPAKPDEILSAITWIRQIVKETYSEKLSQGLRVIYGASVDAEFVGAILGMKGVDGLLPGAASLNYRKFADIVEAAYRVQHQDKT